VRGDHVTFRLCACEGRFGFDAARYVRFIVKDLFLLELVWMLLGRMKDLPNFFCAEEGAEYARVDCADRADAALAYDDWRNAKGFPRDAGELFEESHDGLIDKARLRCSRSQEIRQKTLGRIPGPHCRCFGYLRGALG
jgi:hypothetical protein